MFLIKRERVTVRNTNLKSYHQKSRLNCYHYSHLLQFLLAILLIQCIITSNHVIGEDVIFLRILICDDDNDIVKQLQKYIMDFFKSRKLESPEIQCYSNGEFLLSDTGSKDIVFLDIEMPGLNGIYIGRELKEKNRDTIIFIITSYVEYLDDAMRFHVFRYLSKPLDKQRLFRNMKDALQLYNSTNFKIPIETKEGIYICKASEIILIEAMGRTISIHTLSRDFIVKQNMAHWSRTLNIPCFFQSHRSFIINMKYVTDFDHSLIHLCDDQYTAYLTKRRYSEFKNAYFLYLESTR